MARAGRGPAGELLDLAERLVQQHVQARGEPAAARVARRWPAAVGHGW